MSGKGERRSTSVGAGWESQAWRSDSIKPFGADSIATLAAKRAYDAPPATVEIVPRREKRTSTFLSLSPSPSMSSPFLSSSSISRSSLHFTSTAPIASLSQQDYITSVNNKKELTNHHRGMKTNYASAMLYNLV